MTVNGMGKKATHSTRQLRVDVRQRPVRQPRRPSAHLAQREEVRQQFGRVVLGQLLAVAELDWLTAAGGRLLVVVHVAVARVAFVVVDEHLIMNILC